MDTSNVIRFPGIWVGDDVDQPIIEGLNDGQKMAIRRHVHLNTETIQQEWEVLGMLGLR